MEIPPSQRPSPLVAALARLSSAPPGRAMRHVLGHAPVISFTLSADGTIVRSEGRARDALVARRGETRGRRVQDAYADVPAVVAAAERALRGETVAARLDVSGLTFQVAFDPVVEDGRVVRVEGTAWRPVGDPGEVREEAAAASLAQAGLTVRQAWVARGLTQTEIADRLDVSPTTIHTHTGTLRDVFGAATTGALRRYGQARDWHLLVDAADPPEQAG